jgi:hypothetical protein
MQREFILQLLSCATAINLMLIAVSVQRAAGLRVVYVLPVET